MDEFNINKTLWKRLSGQPLDKSLEETLFIDIPIFDDKLKFYIGSDSHSVNNKTIFSVVLVVLNKGKGGFGYYKRIFDNNIITTKQKLFQETYYAVELAIKINPYLESIGYKIEEIHTDLNPNPNFLSSSMINQCLGYIKGMGFVGRTKPNSWAASSVADLKSK